MKTFIINGIECVTLSDHTKRVNELLSSRENYRTAATTNKRLLTEALPTTEITCAICPEDFDTCSWADKHEPCPMMDNF